MAADSDQKELIDLYGDLIQNDGEDGDFDKSAEANELYDAVLTGSVNQEHRKVSCKSMSGYRGGQESLEESSSKSALKSVKAANPYKRFSIYIGNFSWWTSDKDLLNMALSLGVEDVTEIKFAENKMNGQSRGYAEVVVSSELSFKTLLEKVPQCDLNGDKVDCRFATRHNLGVFEDVANKRIPLRPPKDSKDSDAEKIPSLLSQQPSSSAVLAPFPSYPPPANSFPPIPRPFLSHPPPPFHVMPPNIPPPPTHHMFPVHPVHPSHPVPITPQPSPNLHINPAFFPPVQDRHSSKAYSQQKNTSESTDGDFEELMNRNKAVASSAITKAMSGATTGGMRSAMETLLTAIAIIKQSRVFRDKRCQALITSLKDCLVSIQGNSSYRSRSRSKERDRERDRGRDRERERERERDREESFEVTSRRHREHSASGDRDRERLWERERDRHREHRDRYR